MLEQMQVVVCIDEYLEKPSSIMLESEQIVNCHWNSLEKTELEMMVPAGISHLE